MVAWPLTRLRYLRDVRRRGSGDPGLRRRPATLEAAGAQVARPLVKVTGIGRGTDAMRMADRPHVDYDDFHDGSTPPSRSAARTRRGLLPQAVGSRHPLPRRALVPRRAHRRQHGLQAWPASRPAATSWTSSSCTTPTPPVEIQTYEDLGLCRYGEGGPFAASGKAFMPDIDYGLQADRTAPVCPVNPSGGLIACGHPVGATGLMQGVFAIWQLQGIDREAFRRRDLAGEERPARRDPFARRHRHLRHRLDFGTGSLTAAQGTGVN